MTFQKNWNRNRKERPNKLRAKPTISFRCDPYNYITLNRLKSIGERSNFINKAIATRINLESKRKKFLFDVAMETPDLAKHVVRQVLGIKAMQKKEGIEW